MFQTTNQLEILRQPQPAKVFTSDGKMPLSPSPSIAKSLSAAKVTAASPLQGYPRYRDKASTSG